MTGAYERITCDDVKLGDRIAHTRNAVFAEVRLIDECDATRRLWVYADEYFGLSAYKMADGAWGGNIRPKRAAKLWRETVS